MAQGDFTQEEAVETGKTFGEIFNQLSKKKQIEFFGHANDVYVFLAAAKDAAPKEREA